MAQIESVQISEHVLQFRVPTPTLPPALETNTYLIYDGSVGVLVDAGTQDPVMLQEIHEALGKMGVSRIEALLATHYHRDHVQGLPHLQQRYHAPICVHRLDMEPACKEMNLQLSDVEWMPVALTVGSVKIDIHHAPGHTHGHVHILIPDDEVILVGDHLAGDGSVWVGPPDGHIADYYMALHAIANSGCRTAGPGHGAALLDAPTAAKAMLARRRAREEEIYGILTTQCATVEDLVQKLYSGTVAPEAMWVARRTVKAHLEHLIDCERVNRVYHVTDRCFRYIPR